MSDQVGNSDDRFSDNEAHLEFAHYLTSNSAEQIEQKCRVVCLHMTKKGFLMMWLK